MTQAILYARAACALGPPLFCRTQDYIKQCKPNASATTHGRVLSATKHTEEEPWLPKPLLPFVLPIELVFRLAIGLALHFAD